MKPSVGVTSSNANTRPLQLNSAGPATTAPPNKSNSNVVTYLRVAPAASAAAILQQQRASVVSSVGTGGATMMTGSSAKPQHHQTNGNGVGNGNVTATTGNGNQVLLRRLPNNNMVQIRRIITQQPQQFHEVAAELSSSSSDSSMGFQPIKRKLNGGGSGGRRNGDHHITKSNGNNESMGEVDVSVVDRGADLDDDDDDDEDLLIDQDEDDHDGDGEGKGDDCRTALEMNGEGVDSEYLKHVIETQILNRHKAKIKDWDGTKGHMCQSCHEMFLSETGLDSHRNRRIHHILFFCRYCKRDISFFNKCRLLQHLRNHRVTPTVSGLQNCTMIRLLPESDYLHFKYENCTSSSDEEEKGGGGSGSGGSGPPKRLKPSKFRRVARSSLSGNGLDSPDHSPPPNVTRQIVAPPQQLMASPPVANSSSPVTINANPSTLITANNIGGAIKYAPCNGDEKTQQHQRSDQVTVIKSTGNTTSVILSSPAVKTEKTAASIVKATQPQNSQDVLHTSQLPPPQIRIRNLSQITVSVNEDEDQTENHSQTERVVVVQGRSSLQKATSQIKTEPPSSQIAMSTPKPPPPSQPKNVLKKKYYCYKCDKSFVSNHEFFKHLEEQEAIGFSSRSLHRCPTDDIPSWSQCQYVFHTKVFHEQSVPFVCPGCGFEGQDYNSLMEHVTNNCFYLCLRARYMCAASAEKCSFADKKSVKTEPEIIDHLKKEHSRSVLQCLHCTQGFATENWLLKHLVDAHKINFDESKGEAEREALIKKTTRPLTQCLICNILFPNGPTFLQHVYLNFHMHILHAKMLECQSCFTVFETKEEIANHRKLTEKCRRLDPFHMKISLSSNELVSGSPTSQAAAAMAPTPIKIIANPAAIITASISNSTNSPQQMKQPQQIASKMGPQQVITSVSSNSVNGMQTGKTSIASSQQQQRSEARANQTSQPKNQIVNVNNRPTAQSSSQEMPTVKSSNTTANKNLAKKSFFDDLQSCQFCERLVVYGSLRKHEDQCCGLSTIAPGFCLTCRQNFGDRKTLARHGVVHIKEGLPICLYCNNRLIRPTHPKSSTPSKQENMFSLRKHLYSNHTSKAVHFPFQCPLCSKICNDKRTAEFHIKDHQNKCTDSISTGDPDPAPLPTSAYDSSAMVKLRRKGADPKKKSGKVIDVYYCPVCKNREFALENGLARHLKLVHQKNPKSLNLSLLKKASTARRFVLKSAVPHHTAPPNTVITSSTSSPHRPQLRSFSNSSSADSRTRAGSSSSSQAASILTRSSVNKGSANSSSSTAFTPRFSSGVVLRKRIVAAASIVTGRKPAAVVQKPPNTTTSRLKSTADSSKDYRPPSNFLQTRSAVPTRSARRKDGTFTCFKCPEFTCKTESEFCEHIKWKHVWSESEIQKLQYGNKAALEEPSEFWCPECSTILVAKSSLVRHLKFAHDYITSAEDYMQKIGYDGKKPLKANQCEVCFYQCEDDRDLQQHMRTHGMAFLRLRQQRQLSMNKS